MGDLICANCGSVGRPKTITRGSFVIELLLWICFILPGLLYSIWRLTTRTRGCPTCGAANMVPVDSPVGKRLLSDTHVSTPETDRISGGRAPQETGAPRTTPRQPTPAGKSNAWAAVVVIAVAVIAVLWLASLDKKGAPDPAKSVAAQTQRPLPYGPLR